MLRETLKTESITSNIEFSKHGPYLETDISFFSIASVHSAKFDMHQAQCEVSLGHQWQWVSVKQTRSIWLPPEYRPTCSALRDCTMVLGHASGRVSIIKFTRPI
jgi:hypothetical protein